jgi:PKD repeat protein
MKNIKRVLSLIIIVTIFALIPATAFAKVTSGDVGQFFGEMFSTGDDSISFTTYENVSVSLDEEGFADELTSSTDLKDFIITVVNWALTFLGLISVLVIIYGGVLYVTSGGEEEKTQTGKKAIQYAVVGILIILGSFAFVNTIIKGATDNQQGVGTTGAAFSGGGFNASSSEVKALADELFNGYVFLEQATEDLKNINNDAEKGSLLPENFPSKADVMKFLNSVEERLSNIEKNSPQFSGTASAVSDLLREVDRLMIDVVNDLPDTETYLMLFEDNSDELCPPSKEAIVDSYDAGKPAHCGDWGGDGICDEWVAGDYKESNEAFAQGFMQEYENMSYEESCISAGYNIRYTPGLYGAWSEISGYFVTESPADPIYTDSNDDIYILVLDPLAKDYGLNLVRILSRLQEIYNELSIIQAINSGQGAEYFQAMQNQYGFDSTITSSEEADNIDIRESLNSYADGGLLEKVASWSLETDTDVAGQHLIAGVEAHAAFYSILTELQYVNARLSANVVEGTSPLTVIFDTTGTLDPAGGSIQGSNIYWDIGGTKTTEDLMEQLSAESDDNIITPSDNSVTCSRSTDSITPEGEPSTEGELIGTTAKRCVFHVPGTYSAAIKVNSNAPDQFAPGISVLVIKVKPPKTKIELKGGIGEGMADEQVIMHYEEEVLLIDKREVNFTLGKASEGDGVCLDATGTQGNRYQWDFGNGVKNDFSVGALKECSKYIESGSYEVTLEVANDLGDIDKKIFTIKISSIAARLKASPASEAFIGENVTFDASGAVSDLGSIKNYEWTIEIDEEASSSLSSDIIDDIEDYYEDFNSGNSGSDLVKIEHDFPFPGTYEVMVEVTDESGQQDSENVKFIVNSKAPIAIFENEVPATNQPGTVHFYGSKSYDPDNDDDRMSFAWSIEPDSNGNKTWECVAKGCDDLENFDDPDPIIKFKEKGDYEVTLLVESYGETSEIKKTIEVNNILDIEWADSQTTTAQLNDDAEAQVKFKLESDEAVEYEIDFGDGEVTSGEFSSSGDTAEATHTYTESGTFTVVAKAYDEDYNDNTIKRRIFIGDGVNPVAKASLSINGAKYADLSEPIEITRQDVLTLDASESINKDGTPKDLAFSWDYGSGKSASKSFTHSYDDIGNYTIQLEVFDKDDPSHKSADGLQLNVVAKPPTFSSIQAIPDSRNPELITPVSVKMSAFNAKDEDGEIVQYKWWYYDLNDPDEPLGIQITENPSAQVVIGTLGKEGDEVEYGFGLEVTDSDNMKTSSTDTLASDRIPTIEVVNGANDLPIAKFNVSTTSIFAGDELSFTSASSDPDGTIVKYIWDFEGDGFGNDEPTDKSVVKYAYTSKNLQGYNSRLKVVDDKGGESISDPITIYVDSIATPPIASFIYEVIEGSSGKKIQFTDTSEFDADAGARILSYIWDFDTNSVLASADSNGDGVIDNDTDSKLENPQRLYTSNGMYDVKLTITDNQGNEDSYIETLSIPLAAPPEAAFSYEIAEDMVIFRSDSTADSEKGAVIESLVWDFDTSSALTSADSDGDGDKSNDQDSILEAPTFTYELPGTYEVKLTVTDNRGVTDTIAKAIDVGEAVPDTGLVAILLSDVIPANDAVVYLPGDEGSVTFDFSQSEGAIAYYILDKNIHFDTDGNGVKNDDQDFKTSLPGTWKTNFMKEWGKTVVKLTVTDIYGNDHSTTQEIKFQ